MQREADSLHHILDILHAELNPTEIILNLIQYTKYSSVLCIFLYKLEDLMNEILMYFIFCIFYKKFVNLFLFYLFLTCEWAIWDLHFVQYQYYFKP